LAQEEQMGLPLRVDTWLGEWEMHWLMLQVDLVPQLEQRVSRERAMVFSSRGLLDLGRPVEE
jgi:hypothetical protein